MYCKTCFVSHLILERNSNKTMYDMNLGQFRLTMVIENQPTLANIWFLKPLKVGDCYQSRHMLYLQHFNFLFILGNNTNLDSFILLQKFKIIIGQSKCVFTNVSNFCSFVVISHISQKWYSITSQMPTWTVFFCFKGSIDFEF